jgi:hypothetical protein
MKTVAALALAASLAGIAGVAHAAQSIASAPLPTRPGRAAACYIRNVGSTPMPLQVRLFDFLSAEVTPSFQNCNDAPLLPGRTCVLLVYEFTQYSALGCAATPVVGSARNLRGRLEVRSITASGLKVLVRDDLR